MIPLIGLIIGLYVMGRSMSFVLRSGANAEPRFMQVVWFLLLLAEAVLTLTLVMSSAGLDASARIR